MESSRSESGKTLALFAVLAGHLPLTLKAKTAHGDDEVAFTLTYVQSPHLVTLSSAATHFVKTPDWRQVLEKTRAEDVFESVSESQGPRPSAAVRVDSALCSATAHFFKLCCERMLPVAWTGSRPCWLRAGPPGNSRPLGIPQRVVQHDARDSHQSCTILCLRGLDMNRDMFGLDPLRGESQDHGGHSSSNSSLSRLVPARLGGSSSAGPSPARRSRREMHSSSSLSDSFPAVYTRTAS